MSDDGPVCRACGHGGKYHGSGSCHQCDCEGRFMPVLSEIPWARVVRDLLTAHCERGCSVYPHKHEDDCPKVAAGEAARLALADAAGAPDLVTELQAARAWVERAVDLIEHDHGEPPTEANEGHTVPEALIITGRELLERIAPEPCREAEGHGGELVCEKPAGHDGPCFVNMKPAGDRCLVCGRGWQDPVGECPACRAHETRSRMNPADAVALAAGVDPADPTVAEARAYLEEPVLDVIQRQVARLEGEAASLIGPGSEQMAARLRAHARELRDTVEQSALEGWSADWRKMLEFLAGRLVHVYGESPNTDYILKALELTGRTELAEQPACECSCWACWAEGPHCAGRKCRGEAR